MSNFVELCLLGEADPEKIDDYVDAWHDDSQGLALHQFLGMSRSEYSLWVGDPGVLHFILDAHRTGEDVNQLMRT